MLIYYYKRCVTSLFEGNEEEIVPKMNWLPENDYFCHLEKNGNVIFDRRYLQLEDIARVFVKWQTKSKILDSFITLNYYLPIITTL